MNKDHFKRALALACLAGSALHQPTVPSPDDYLDKQARKRARKAHMKAAQARAFKGDK